VAGHGYQVCFFFLDGKLIQVTLTSLDRPTIPQSEGIITLLRSKYGQELSYERDPIGYEVDWYLASGVNVDVTFNIEPPVPPLLNINYQFQMSKDREKL